MSGFGTSWRGRTSNSDYGRFLQTSHQRGEVSPFNQQHNYYGTGGGFQWDQSQPHQHFPNCPNMQYQYQGGQGTNEDPGFTVHVGAQHYQPQQQEEEHGSGDNSQPQPQETPLEGNENEGKTAPPMIPASLPQKWKGLAGVRYGRQGQLPPTSISAADSNSGTSMIMNMSANQDGSHWQDNLNQLQSMEQLQQQQFPGSCGDAYNYNKVPVPTPYRKPNPSVIVRPRTVVSSNQNLGQKDFPASTTGRSGKMEPQLCGKCTKCRKYMPPTEEGPVVKMFSAAGRGRKQCAPKPQDAKNFRAMQFHHP